EPVDGRDQARGERPCAGAEFSKEEVFHRGVRPLLVIAHVDRAAADPCPDRRVHERLWPSCLREPLRRPVDEAVREVAVGPKEGLAAQDRVHEAALLSTRLILLSRSMETTAERCPRGLQIQSWMRIGAPPEPA